MKFLREKWLSRRLGESNKRYLGSKYAADFEEEGSSEARIDQNTLIVAEDKKDTRDWDGKREEIGSREAFAG